MRTCTRWLVVAAAALVLAIAGAACGDSDGSDEDAVGGGGDGAPGVPAGDADDEAPGAPIRIPSIQQDQGRPLDEVLAEIESAVRDQCGGELCIELRVERSDDGFTECQFVRTEPPQDTEVARGSTVVVVAGTQPCEDDAPDTGDGSTDEDDAPDEGSDEDDQ